MESSKPSPRSKDAEFGSQMPSIAPPYCPQQNHQITWIFIDGAARGLMESSKPSPRSKDAEFGSQKKKGMPSIRPLATTLAEPSN